MQDLSNPSYAIQKTLQYLNNFLFKYQRKGYLVFNLGLFLLPSAPAIAVILFFISILISSFNRKDKYLEDIWNYPLIISSILMIISSVAASFYSETLFSEDLDSSLAWVSLANWIPLFVCFWGFQPYLSSANSRKTSAMFILCGTIPVVITGFGQYWFDWYGPIDIFNGFIIWFQRPLKSGGGLTGLFNNSNYAGCLLSTVLPFALASLFHSKPGFVRRSIILLICSGLLIISCLSSFANPWLALAIGLLPFAFFITIKPSINFFNHSLLLLINSSLIISIVLTNSRNAWIGLLIALAIILPIPRLYFLTIIGLGLSLILSFYFIPLLFEKSLFILSNFLPSRFMANFDLSLLSSEPRIILWFKTIKYILERPILGWGGGSFPYIFPQDKGIGFFWHAHSLPLQIAVDYGLLTSMLIYSTILRILINSFREVFKKRKAFLGGDFFEKAWFSSAIVIIISHMFDITYFDLRISLLFWILLSGLKEIIQSEKYST